MDPLSNVLSMLKLQGYAFGGFEAGGAWSIAFPAQPGIKLYAVVTGRCWLAVEGVPEPVNLQAGDCVLLPRGRAFRVASDLALTPRDLGPAAGGGLGDGGILHLAPGNDFFTIGGYFTLSGGHTEVLLDVLPAIVHLHLEPDRAVLRWCIERMRDELREPKPGSSWVAQHLTTLMLVVNDPPDPRTIGVFRATRSPVLPAGSPPVLPAGPDWWC